jgi:hypothetical protein
VLSEHTIATMTPFAVCTVREFVQVCEDAVVVFGEQLTSTGEDVSAPEYSVTVTHIATTPD